MNPYQFIFFYQHEQFQFKPTYSKTKILKNGRQENPFIIPKRGKERTFIGQWIQSKTPLLGSWSRRPTLLKPQPQPRIFDKFKCHYRPTLLVQRFGNDLQDFVCMQRLNTKADPSKFKFPSNMNSLAIRRMDNFIYRAKKDTPCYATCYRVIINTLKQQIFSWTLFGSPRRL